MRIWILTALLFATPAFGASMNTYASQLGGLNQVQLIPGQLPMLTTTFAGTTFQSEFPSALIFQTNVPAIGTLTLGYSLTIGGQQFSLPIATYSCTNALGCFFAGDFTMPTLYHPTQGTLTVNMNGSAFTFGFVFQSPVPEPASLLLFATGVIAVGLRRYRRIENS